MAIILSQNRQKSRNSLLLTLELAEFLYGLAELELLAESTLELAEFIRQGAKKSILQLEQTNKASIQ